jgi:light-regulated signal transduction histidine kinase (bacteriophytochrome)
VASYVQLLEREYAAELDDQARAYMEFAGAGVQRMHALIVSLLAYSRLGTRAVEPVETDPNQVLEEIVRQFQTEGLAGEAEIQVETLPAVWADRVQLAQVFRNLIGNALKFRAATGPCRVAVQAELQADHTVRFAVRDNGPGIEPAYQERIFLLFQRLHRHDEYPGSGMGLAICRRIVEGHGGKIWVESQPGEGSTFCFTLPGVQSPPGTSPS